MPTVSVSRDVLLRELNWNRQDKSDKQLEKEFDELCFDFGIELDDVTVEDGVINYKIDVPANRPDLCCLEGIVIALLSFQGKDFPKIEKVELPKEERYSINVDKSTAAIRPYVVSAILRDMTFTAESYASFIDFQDKLHHNICRRRALVAIGTHDLDKIEAGGSTQTFTYTAEAPKDIVFAPLNKTEPMDGSRLMEVYEDEAHIRPFLGIIRDSPVYPVIRDGSPDRRVLSLPPIINGDFSKMSVETKNVFIECTATDLTRAKTVLNTLIGTFGRYAATPFRVEAVDIVYGPECTPAQLEASAAYPDLTAFSFTVPASYINRSTGLALTAGEWAPHLIRMMNDVAVDTEKDVLKVTPAAFRSDVLQACDVVEDATIAYGFNKMPVSLPHTAVSGGLLPVNRLTEVLRVELAAAGYSEALAFVLCSAGDTSTSLRKPIDNVALIANPKSLECKAARNTLVAGLLKTIAHNKSAPRPLRLFEVSDVITVDKTVDVGAKNERRIATIYSGMTAGFEITHGMLDRIAQLLGVPGELTLESAPATGRTAHLMPARATHIMYKGAVVGELGVVHPEVLETFGIVHPCSCLELTLEPFIELK